MTHEIDYWMADQLVSKIVHDMNTCEKIITRLKKRNASQASACGAWEREVERHCHAECGGFEYIYDKATRRAAAEILEQKFHERVVGK